MNKSSQNFLVILLLCLSCGLAIITAYALLSPRIDIQQRKTTEAIYFEALKLQPSSSQLDSSHTTDDTVLLGLRTPQHLYIARQENRIVGIVLPLTAREGYGGDIDLLLGLDPNGKIISVRVVSQHETRDLGDKIEPEKSNWLDIFRGTAFDETQKNRWQLHNDDSAFDGTFDGITGATVTSRAVVKAVQQGLEYFAVHRSELLGSSNNE